VIICTTDNSVALGKLVQGSACYLYSGYTHLSLGLGIGYAVRYLVDFLSFFYIWRVITTVVDTTSYITYNQTRPNSSGFFYFLEFHVSYSLCEVCGWFRLSQDSLTYSLVSEHFFFFFKNLFSNNLISCPSLGVRGQASHPHTLHVSAEWLPLLLRVRKAPGSNLGPETGCPVRGFSWLLSVPQGKWRDNTLI
jgi:hypothetical protein